MTRSRRVPDAAALRVELEDRPRRPRAASHKASIRGRSPRAACPAALDELVAAVAGDDSSSTVPPGPLRRAGWRPSSYFVCSEAIANVAKYAPGAQCADRGARPARTRLRLARRRRRPRRRRSRPRHRPARPRRSRRGARREPATSQARPAAARDCRRAPARRARRCPSRRAELAGREPALRRRWRHDRARAPCALSAFAGLRGA